MDRRLWLASAGAWASLPLIGARAAADTRRSFASNPFAVGVASGDADEHGMVLWTRLCPAPLEPGGGMGQENVRVRWQIADDDSMKRVVQQGTAVACPELAHSVHVEVSGLRPDRWYWYQFRAGDAESPVGRTRTMPPRDSQPDELRLAFASCQDYESGFYTAYEHMIRDQPDLILHLGDYIYEYGGTDEAVRRHVGGEIVSLDDYRIRHALYKTDPLLQAAHACCPWLVSWDDHELDNNYADEISEEADVDPAWFMKRRAAAYQAYYEMMPLRAASIPRGPDMQLYRKASFGQLAELLMLDTRQYRTDQPNGDRICDVNDAACTADGTLLGAEQLGWVQSSLAGSEARWNVLAQQVMMGMVDFTAGGERGYYMDEWPGYMTERQRLLKFIAESRVSDPIVLTGDFHANFANDIRLDDRQGELPVVATEFVGTSISSGGNGYREAGDYDAVMAENPCVKFYNAERGYVNCIVRKDEWRSDFRVVEDITRPGAPAITRASFVVEAGRAGVQSA